MGQRSDFTTLGINPIGDYVEGQEAAYARPLLRQKLRGEADLSTAHAANTSAQAQRTQGLADDEAYARGKVRGLDTGYAGIDEGQLNSGTDAYTGRYAASGLDTNAAPTPGAQAGASGAAPAPGAGLAMGTSAPPPVPAGPAAAAGPDFSAGNRYRAMAKVAQQNKAHGDFETNIAAAKTADYNAVKSHAMRQFMADPDAARKAMLTANGSAADPEGNPGIPHLAIGVAPGSPGYHSGNVEDSHGKDTKYSIIVMDPSANGYAFNATPEDMATIAGATAAMKIDPQAALAEIKAVNAHLATLYATKLDQQIKVQAGNSAAIKDAQAGEAGMVTARAHATTAQAHMITANAAQTRAETEKTKQAFGQPVKLLDENNKPIYMQPTMVNGKMSMTKVDMPDGAHFPGQKNLTPVKTPNGTIMTDTETGDALYKFDQDNNVAPVEKDIFAGKEGEKLMAGWQAKGVQRIVNSDNGKLHWGYVRTGDPSGDAYSTPEEALAKGKPEAAAPSKMPSKRNAAPGLDMSGAAPSSVPSPEARTAFLRSRIAADDQVKAGGLAGMGGRAIRLGAMPLSMGERAAAQDELRRLGQ